MGTGMIIALLRVTLFFLALSFVGKAGSFLKTQMRMEPYINVAKMKETTEYFNKIVKTHLTTQEDLNKPKVIDKTNSEIKLENEKMTTHSVENPKRLASVPKKKKRRSLYKESKPVKIKIKKKKQPKKKKKKKTTTPRPPPKKKKKEGGDSLKGD